MLSTTPGPGRSLSAWGMLINEVDACDPELFHETARKAPHLGLLLRRTGPRRAGPPSFARRSSGLGQAPTVSMLSTAGSGIYAKRVA